VFGKIIGESPDGPRRRKPLKNSAPDRKSPYSLPTASPTRGPPSSPASLAARRQAASAMRQMRDRRRTSAASRSAMSPASSPPARLGERQEPGAGALGRAPLCPPPPGERLRGGEGFRGTPQRGSDGR